MAGLSEKGKAVAEPEARRQKPEAHLTRNSTVDSRMRLPRTVIALGVVSLLTDASSEMIYPLLPLFLSTALGAGPLAIGAIEGAAESVASLLKLFSGWWSDRLPRRKPLVIA